MEVKMKVSVVNNNRIQFSPRDLTKLCIIFIIGKFNIVYICITLYEKNL